MAIIVIIVLHISLDGLLDYSQLWQKKKKKEKKGKKRVPVGADGEEGGLMKQERMKRKSS